MYFLYKLAGGLATSPGCFFALLFPLLIWLCLRGATLGMKRVARVALFLLATMYILFTPFTAEFLMRGLEIPRPPLPDDDVPTLVAVLAGGGTHPVPGGGGEIELGEQSYQRLAEGVKVARARKWPLLYSGAYEEGDPDAYEAAIRKSAKEWGLGEGVFLDSVSRNSWENLEQIARFAREKGFKRVVLSTTAYHMKRALWMAGQKIDGDVEIVPWPSGWRSTRDRLTVYAFGPSARAFHDSCTALRERIGLLAYSLLRGRR